MQTKLILNLEKSLIEKAELYAEKSGKSVSQMVAYFETLDQDLAAELADLPPITRSLSGVLKNKGVTEQDYYDHLEAKHLEAGFPQLTQ